MSTAKHSLQYLLEQYQKQHNLVSDSLVCILMNAAFVFDPVNHATLTDVSASEIATGNGYTQGGKAVANAAASINTVDEKVVVTADNVSWTASGGNIEESAAAIIYNSTHASDTIVVGIQFDTTKTAVDGTNLVIDLSAGLAKALIEIPTE